VVNKHQFGTCLRASLPILTVVVAGCVVHLENCCVVAPSRQEACYGHLRRLPAEVRMPGHSADDGA